MAFSSARTNDVIKVGSGEKFGVSGVDLTARSFEDGLKVGRFAKQDTGRIDNMDGSVSPVIAGVVLRNVANPLEDAGVIDADLYEQIEFRRQGLVSVDVKSGETPTRFGRVYVSNAGDANDGLATATNTDVAVNAEFIEEVQSGVWLIYVNPAPGDIAAHTGDASGAHAASAISLADAAGNTAATEVEAAVAELYKIGGNVSAIADPGDAGAIAVTRSGVCALTSGAAGETRTIAIPTFLGQQIALVHSVDGGGDVAITAASAINQAGNTVITTGDAGDVVVLTAIKIGANLAWRVLVNDGAVLS